MKVKRKVPLYGLAFAIALFLACSLIYASNQKDFKVKKFTESLDNLTTQIVGSAGDPLTLEGMKNARKTLDDNKADLNNSLKDLKSGPVQVNTNTEVQLDKCFSNNLNLLEGIYNRYLKKFENDSIQLKNAKDTYFKKDSAANWNELNNKLAVLKEDDELQEAIKELMESYKSILNRESL